MSNNLTPAKVTPKGDSEIKPPPKFGGEWLTGLGGVEVRTNCSYLCHVETCFNTQIIVRLRSHIGYTFSNFAIHLELCELPCLWR